MAPKNPAATSHQRLWTDRQRTAQTIAAVAGTAAASSPSIVKPSAFGATPTTATIAAAAIPVARERSIHPRAPTRSVSATPARTAPARIAHAWYATSVSAR